MPYSQSAWYPDVSAQLTKKVTPANISTCHHTHASSILFLQDTGFAASCLQTVGLWPQLLTIIEPSVLIQWLHVYVSLLSDCRQWQKTWIDVSLWRRRFHWSRLMNHGWNCMQAMMTSLSVTELLELKCDSLHTPARWLRPGIFTSYTVGAGWMAVPDISWLI